MEPAFIQQQQHSLSQEFHQYILLQQPIYSLCQDCSFSQKRTKKLQLYKENDTTISLRCQYQYASLIIQQFYIYLLINAPNLQIIQFIRLNVLNKLDQRVLFKKNDQQKKRRIQIQGKETDLIL
ncbi:unnamed protein product [Paramecium sonneborni]|uniref:Uncharacterized protein n=1 Tax=Paramecium sonneborni TaxID=65129 RepID=A0A8S1QNP9_9CILI|nr:unnamed protein product [Paramecium sonneborni]